VSKTMCFEFNRSNVGQISSIEPSITAAEL
jgi:hypothetical protein